MWFSRASRVQVKPFYAVLLEKKPVKGNSGHGIFIRLPDLLLAFEEATIVPRAVSKLLKKFSACTLLILDEWLLEDISDKEQHFLMELIERRHDATSTIFCTQYRRDNWHDRLGGGVHADAILDRIVHNAVWIETGDMNMREFQAKNTLPF